jgi:hypothetical protein
VQPKIITPVFVITFPFTLTTWPDFTSLNATKVALISPVDFLFLGAMDEQLRSQISIETTASRPKSDTQLNNLSLETTDAACDLGCLESLTYQKLKESEES